MKKIIILVCLVITALVIIIYYSQESETYLKEPESSRVITIGGAVTEIVWALGGNGQVVAVDQSSTYPPEVSNLPDVGYIRQINAEGVLAMNPTLILTTQSLAPKVAAEQIINSGVRVVSTPIIQDLDSLITAIGEFGKALNKNKEAQELQSKIRTKANKIDSTYKKQKKPRMLLLINHSGRFSAAGKGTKGNGFLEWTGGKNVFDSINGYKSISQEALLSEKPDIILFAQSSATPPSSPKDIFDKLGISVLSEAGTQVYPIQMGHLSFGPRTVDMVLELVEKIYSK